MPKNYGKGGGVGGQEDACIGWGGRQKLEKMWEDLGRARLRYFMQGK